MTTSSDRPDMLPRGHLNLDTRVTTLVAISDGGRVAGLMADGIGMLVVMIPPVAANSIGVGDRIRGTFDLRQGTPPLVAAVLADKPVAHLASAAYRAVAALMVARFLAAPEYPNRPEAAAAAVAIGIPGLVARVSEAVTTSVRPDHPLVAALAGLARLGSACSPLRPMAEDADKFLSACEHAPPVALEKAIRLVAPGEAAGWALTASPAAILPALNAAPVIEFAQIAAMLRGASAVSNASAPESDGIADVRQAVSAALGMESDWSDASGWLGPG